MIFHETIILYAERKQLAPLRRFVEQQAGKTKASAEEVQDLVLAVDEAATNVIVHGYQDKGGMIELVLEHQPGRITIILRDEASLFDPTTVPEPDLCLPLEERPIGGLGVHIIRRSVDEVSYSIRSPGGNELKLVKYLANNGGQE